MAIFDIAFLINVVIELHFAEYKDNTQLRYLLKPIPIVMLILNLSFVKTKIAKTMNIGLILSLVGDVMLCFKGLQNFLIGTVFFFLAHVVYIYALRLPNSTSSSSHSTNPLLYAACLIVYALAGLSVYQLFDVMPAKMLIIPYGMILSTMTCCALIRYNLTTPLSYWQGLIGSILFAVSDSILGTFKFNNIKSVWGFVSVMATYYFAQYFIMKGAISHEVNTDSDKKQR